MRAGYLQRCLTFIYSKGKTGSWSRGKMHFFLVLEGFQHRRTGTAGVIALNLWIWSWWGTPVLFAELAFTLDSEKQKPCPFPKGTGRSVQGAGRDLFTLQLGSSHHHLGICLTA